jgi:hypothetical protein
VRRDEVVANRRRRRVQRCDLAQPAGVADLRVAGGERGLPFDQVREHRRHRDGVDGQPAGVVERDVVTSGRREPRCGEKRLNRMRWWRGSVAAALVVVAVAAVSGWVWAVVAGGGLLIPASMTARACDLPTRPGHVPAGQGLAGPVVTALRGGAAAHGFAVDGGLLSVEPPPPGAVPRVPRMLAECEALAAIGSNGALDVAAEEWGLVIGYAMVTVLPGLPTDSSSWQSYGQAMPRPASYRNRLAWVVVFRTQLTASCPAAAVTTPPATPAPPPGPPAYTGYGYEVFLIDAATGGDALIYDQTQPVPCGGTGVVPAGVAVPVEETSVPWTLDRRNPDRFSAVLTADVPPCDFHDSVAGVIPGTALVRVLAYGPVAARCGPPRPVTVDLEAASVTQNLPPVLVHAPAGLYLPGTGNTTSGQSSGPPTGTLITLGILDSGQTITMHVGDVLAPPGLFPGEDPSTAQPARSSDPAVLGSLDIPERGPFAEFRAWQPGQATLTTPGQTWLVHVTVLARP